MYNHFWHRREGNGSCSGLMIEPLVSPPSQSYIALWFLRARVSNIQSPFPTLPREVEHSLETPQAVSTVPRPGILAENNTPNVEGGWV